MRASVSAGPRSRRPRMRSATATRCLRWARDSRKSRPAASAMSRPRTWCTWTSIRRCSRRTIRRRWRSRRLGRGSRPPARRAARRAGGSGATCRGGGTRRRRQGRLRRRVAGARYEGPCEPAAVLPGTAPAARRRRDRGRGRRQPHLPRRGTHANPPPRGFLSPTDFNCMGYCVPATIGAKLARPARRSWASSATVRSA